MTIAALIALLKTNGHAVLIGLAAIAVLSAATWLFNAGRSYEQAKTDRAAVRAFEERNKIDERLDGLSPGELCRLAGGDNRCDSVRGGTP